MFSFLQFIQRHAQRGFVIGNGPDLIHNGAAIGVAEPHMARLRSDIFGFTTHEKPLTRAGEFVLGKLQGRRSAIEGEDVMGVHE